ncbi:MAG: hypothetical protein JXB07_05705 [Anaerolineae bacterium]|nr:hypothetical protein [Anaerolineae bacterium]
MTIKSALTCLVAAGKTICSKCVSLPRRTLLFLGLGLGLLAAAFAAQPYTTGMAAPALYNRPVLANAANPLSIPTYEGSGQAVHPDVVYVPGGWKGYKYWMVMVPYPYSNGIYENPSIVASNDNQTWKAVTNNPIVPNPDPGKYVQSDPDILLVNNIMYVYFRRNTKISGSSETTTLYRICSTNGVDWGYNPANPINPEYCALTATSIKNVNSRTFASPSVIYKNGKYHLFSVDTTDKKQVHYRYSPSGDGLNWYGDQTVSLTLDYAWHLDVVPYQNHYLMLINNYDLSSDPAYSTLYYFHSENMKTWTYGGAVLKKSGNANAWDSQNIYRSSFVIEPRSNGKTYFRVWYSAFKDNDDPGSGDIPHIGYTEAEWTYGSAAAPTCESWTDVYINDCNSWAAFEGQSPACTTTNRFVDLKIYGTNKPTQMQVVNVPDPSWYCTDSRINWPSSWSTYTPLLKGWKLFDSNGIKKVCVRLRNNMGESSFSKCGGEIRLQEE